MTTIRCANCLHCKEFYQVSDLTGSRERRVRCAAGMWTTPAGREKSYPLFTVLARQVEVCLAFESMGEEDEEEFLRDLRATLPVERIIEQAPPRDRLPRVRFV